MAPRPPIQAVIETQAELDEGRRHWRMVLFNEDGTPFLSEDGVLGPTTLAALTDVNLAGLADGDILVWDTTTNKWIRAAAPSGGGAGVTVEDWQAPTDLSAHFSSNAAAPVEFRKDSLGKVTIRGGVDVVSAFSWNDTLFTLPDPDYAPTQVIEVLQPYHETFGGGANMQLWLTVNIDGAVKLITQVGGSVNAGVGSRLILDGIEFYND